jgi:large subunit ribosomal protein L29
MLAKDLKERTTEDLRALATSLKRELFFSRLKNSTNQLSDTSLIRKTRKDCARIETILASRKPATPGSES